MNTFMPLEHLSELSRRSFSSREQALDAVFRTVSDLLGMQVIYLSNISQQEDLATLAGVYVVEGGLPLKVGMQLPLSQILCDMLIRTPTLEPLVFNDIQSDPVAQVHPFAQSFPMIQSYVGVPVTLTDGTLYGTLCAIDAHTQNLSAQHTSFLLVLARIVAMQIECGRELSERLRVEESLRIAHEQLQKANETLASLATTDPITHLPNHRATLTYLENLLAHACQNNCAVCFIDLDHFKNINDTYGHESGDIALREIAQVMSRSLRVGDFLGRWGGEEFVIILNTSREDDALEMAERLRHNIAAHPLPIGAGIHVSASLGVALSVCYMYDRTALIEAADKAMYLAKKSGRNQVCFALDIPQTINKEVNVV